MKRFPSRKPTSVCEIQAVLTVVIQPGHECFKLFPSVEKMQTKPQVPGIFQRRNQDSVFFNQLLRDLCPDAAERQSYDHDTTPFRTRQWRSQVELLRVPNRCCGFQ